MHMQMHVCNQKTIIHDRGDCQGLHSHSSNPKATPYMRTQSENEKKGPLQTGPATATDGREGVADTIVRGSYTHRSRLQKRARRKKHSVKYYSKASRREATTERGQRREGEDVWVGRQEEREGGEEVGAAYRLNRLNTKSLPNMSSLSTR